MSTFIHDTIPAKYRKVIYGILGTIVAVESVLDASDVGLIPETAQQIGLSIATVLGFGMAFTQTRD